MLTNLPAYLAYARKAIVNVIGLGTALLTLGLLPDKYAAIVATVVAALTSIIHFSTSNGDKPGTTPALEELDPTADDAGWSEDELSDPETFDEPVIVADDAPVPTDQPSADGEPKQLSATPPTV